MPRRTKEQETPEFSDLIGDEFPDFSEEFAGLEVDPDPAPPPTKGRAKTPKALPGRVTVTARRAVGKEIGSALEMLAKVWAVRDPVCGQVALEQCAELSDALTDWVCDHPGWVRYITEAATGGKAVRVVWAAWPLLMTVYMHHVAGAIPPGDPGAGDDFAGGVNLDGFPAPAPGAF